MFRLFVSMLIGVAILGTVACEKQNRNATIRKNLGNGSSDAAVALTAKLKGIKEASGKASCLLVDQIVETIVDPTEKEITVYATDADLGEIVSAEEGSFAPSEDRALVADVVLRGLSIDGLVINKPSSVATGEKAVVGTFVGRFLRAIELSDDCKTLKLKRTATAEATTYDVIGKSENSLIVQSREGGEVLHYIYDGATSLKVTAFTPTQSPEVCGQPIPSVVKRSYVIDFNGHNKQFKIVRTFADLVAASLANSEDLNAILENTPKSTSIINFEHDFWTGIIGDISRGELANDKCAGNG